MFTYKNALVAAERRKEALAAADRARLIRQMAGRNLEPKRTYRRWLIRLGERMVAWGSELQSRYADAWMAPGAVSRQVRQG